MRITISNYGYPLIIMDIFKKGITSKIAPNTLG